MKKLLTLLLSLTMVLSLAACGGSAPASAPAPEEPTEEPVEEEIMAETLIVDGYIPSVEVLGFDWGPAVTKAILKMDSEIDASSVSPDAFAVSENKEAFNFAAFSDSALDPTKHITVESPRTVTAAYTCDADGNAVEGASRYLALEMAVGPNMGSPYCYDVLTSHNTVCDPYELYITVTGGLTSGGVAVSSESIIQPDVDLAMYAQPQLQGVEMGDLLNLTYAFYAPENADDGKNHPLVVWLHGAGEGGTDPTIAVLGNKVSALFGEEFQSIMGGAYVLAPQTPTFWLQHDEEGSWSDNPGADSIYLEDLMSLIDHFAYTNAVDLTRIYVGGCSNGGFMTMDLVLNYPDKFAAAFPICEAYNDAGITDEQLEGIRDLPIWFVYAKNDNVVDPAVFEIPTIQRLQAMDADVHTSIFEDVHDTSGLYNDADGNPYQYMGHWSWLYFFNNECEENGVSLWQWMAEQHR